MGTKIGTGPYIKDIFKDSCAAIHEADPKTRVYASIHHNNYQGKQGIGECFLPDVDVFCTNAIHEDPKLGDKARAAGKAFWQYSGIGSNSGCGLPDQARYTYGFYFGTFDSRGSLTWAYNWGCGFDTSAPGSNWIYAWQTPFDTIPSPWFEGFREGWDDRRVSEVFKQKFAGKPEMKILNGIHAAVLKEMSGKQNGGRDTVNDFWNAIDDIGRMDLWRNELLNELVK